MEVNCTELEVTDATLGIDCAELGVDAEELVLSWTELEAGAAVPRLMKAGSVKLVIRSAGSALKSAADKPLVKSKAIAAAVSDILRR